MVELTIYNFFGIDFKLDTFSNLIAFDINRVQLARFMYCLQHENIIFHEMDKSIKKYGLKTIAILNKDTSIIDNGLIVIGDLICILNKRSSNDLDIKIDKQHIEYFKSIQ